MKKIKLLGLFLVVFVLAGCSGGGALNSVGTATDGNEQAIEKAAIR